MIQIFNKLESLAILHKSAFSGEFVKILPSLYFYAVLTVEGPFDEDIISALFNPQDESGAERVTIKLEDEHLVRTIGNTYIHLIGEYEENTPFGELVDDSNSGGDAYTYYKETIIKNESIRSEPIRIPKMDEEPNVDLDFIRDM